MNQSNLRKAGTGQPASWHALTCKLAHVWFKNFNSHRTCAIIPQTLTPRYASKILALYAPCVNKCAKEVITLAKSCRPSKYVGVTKST